MVYESKARFLAMLDWVAISRDHGSRVVHFKLECSVESLAHHLEMGWRFGVLLVLVPMDSCSRET